MESFDVTDISNALKEVTGEKINKNVEASNLAREKGWVLPEQYDYTKYNSGSAEKPEEVTEQSESRSGLPKLLSMNGTMSSVMSVLPTKNSRICCSVTSSSIVLASRLASMWISS